MALINFKPTSPGTRFQVRVSKSHLSRRSLRAVDGRPGPDRGAQSFGRITTRHQRRRLAAEVSHHRFPGDKTVSAGMVRNASNTIEPHRAHRVDLYSDGERRYILGPRA